MSSPAMSSGISRPAELFVDLWRQLGECHQNALQELETKVAKLKKERCLDAQKLELFHSRNQQMKEQNTNLQDAISLLEERLRAGGCDRCAILEERLKKHQEQNLRLMAELKNERNDLKDENRKLQAEVEGLKMSCSELQHASSPEQEEGFIPDSPVMPSSLPMANRLKKRKNMDKSRRVQYTERPLTQSNNSLFSELNKKPVGKNPGRAEVLVPNTCDLDSSQISNEASPDREEVIAETCAFEMLANHPMKSDVPAVQPRSSNPLCKNNISLKPLCSSPPSTLIHSPDSTLERSPSLLPRLKRLSEDSSFHKAKRKKEEFQRTEDIKHGTQERAESQKEVRNIEPELIKRSSSPNQCVMKPLPESEDKQRQVQSGQNEPTASPVFKKPDVMCKASGGGAGRKRTTLQDVNMSHDQHEAENAERKYKVEPMWSIDPALALSMYDSEEGGDEQTEKQCHEELEDTDCTWVSHSLLQCHGEKDGAREDSISGLGEKANDSLDMMFDTTACGEYKSYNSSHAGHSQHCGSDDDDEEEEEEDEKDNEQDAPEDSPGQSKSRHPTFAHVAVIRKKDERRKLKGATCKECEIYYAHLPEEEKQNKLSACSRHRFLYIPPSTPENFWEVGFPSTQTCIERGYINEEKTPPGRSRRRQPLNALFSPKQES